MAPKDSLLETLAAHYSETFALIKTAVEKRDRLLLYILMIIFLMLLYMNSPKTSGDWLNSFINNQSGAEGDSTLLIEASFIGVLLHLGLLSLSHTYFQTVLHIERQYNYIYQLEDELGSFFGGKAFSREGKHYQKNRRQFAKWTKVIFWYLFPLLYLFFMISWLNFLYTKSDAPKIYLFVHSLLGISIFTSLYFYLLSLIKKK